MMVKLLLDAGADPKSKDNSGKTVLDDSLRPVRFLVEAALGWSAQMAADPENRDGRKRVAAEVAVEKRLDTVMIFMEDFFSGL